ncbi:MAG: rhodanese-like domain-containing protein [Pantoea sp. Brub]|nr:rhodanese-like domain-containing protein [Pantoea sp. Brub]
MQEIIDFISNHLIISSIWLFLLISLLVISINKSFSKIKIIECNEVIELMNKQDAIIIDLRPYQEYCKGHILGSINLVIDDIKKKNFNILEKYKIKPVILICTNAQNAFSISSYFTKNNFNKVYALKDGIANWNNKHLPLIIDKK